LAIVRAGLLPTLHYEIRQAIAYQRSLQWDPRGQVNRDAEPLDGFRHGDGWHLRGIRGQAAELAKLLECDAAEVEPYVFMELWTGPTTRKITLDTMATVAGHARKQLAAEASKQRFAGRRSA